MWHPVVASLTIHILGASTAEIFLPTIEMIKYNFQIHPLGPSLIFGSGAYHIFLITAVCIISPQGEIAKKIEDLPVFVISAFFAAFSYLWVFFVVDVISPDRISLLEAILTVAFFPLFVVTAWMVEKRYHIKLWRRLKKCDSTVKPYIPDPENSADDMLDIVNDKSVQVEKRKRIADLLKDLRTKNPGKSENELEEMAEIEMLESVPKGAAYYRMQASKSLYGAGPVISHDRVRKRLEYEHKLHDDEENLAHFIDEKVQRVGFQQSHYTCMENCGHTVLTVQRSGNGVETTTLKLSYETHEMTAIAQHDYEETSGILEFDPGCTTKDITVDIIDDDEFEEDKEFKVVLTSLKDLIGGPEVRFSNKEAIVNILDDDHCGVFHFGNTDMAVPDDIGVAKIKVVRSKGARGRVKVPFRVFNGTAKEGTDYSIAKDVRAVEFGNDEFEAEISVNIVDADRVGEIFTFFIELLSPVILSKPPENPLGKPVIGDISKIKIGICEDNELADALDRLIKVGEIAELFSTTSWADQFKEALIPPAYASAFPEDEHEEDVIFNRRERCNRCRRDWAPFRLYLLYLLSLPWKLFAAFVPPAGILHGWLAFIVLLFYMALVSALIGDVASSFGCTVGVKDTVTAITLISFGMSLPDTFASRQGAIIENSADASIGGILGSNAVTVYVGIGVSWLVGAIYNVSNGDTLKLPNMDLGFLVAVFFALESVAIIVLLLRRLPPIRGEIGGPKLLKILSSSFFAILWICFVTLLTLQAYCVISGF